MKKIAVYLSVSVTLFVSFVFSANAAVRPNPIREYGKTHIIKPNPIREYHVPGGLKVF